MTSTTVQTVTLSDTVVDGIAWVGKIVTHQDGTMHQVHSVEGGTFYAHLSDVRAITVDAHFPHADWIMDDNPVVMIIPVGHRMGEGFGREVYLSTLRRGVSLVKTWV